MGTPRNLRIPPDLFRNIAVPLLAHNWKFDLKVLRKAGIDIPTGNLWDTLAMSHFVCEWSKKLGKQYGHALENVAPLYLGVDSQKEVAKGKVLQPVWEITPPYLMAQYAEQDSRLLPELYKKLLSLMKPEWIVQWEEVDRDFMLLLADMETLGIPIDRELALKLHNQCVDRMYEIEQELGFDPAKPSQLHPRLFSDPPVGLGLKISQQTPTHKPKVDLDWLQAHSGHRLCALVYEYRKQSKQVSSYFSPYLDLTTWGYARLHCDFRQYGTMTGRMSCADPNLQQIPREEYKDAYVKKCSLPEEGKQLWEIDFRTLEYRMMTKYCQEPKLLDLWEREGDLHQMVADDIGVDRHTAKNKVVYATAYGAGAKSIAESLGLGMTRGYEVVNKFKSEYPMLFAKMASAQKVAERDMAINMWFGRTRHFKYKSECHKAFNSVIQGGGFEVVKRSMLKLREAGFTMSNQVHDSVWINTDSESEVIEAQRLMEDWTKEDLGIRFSTDRKRLN